VPGQVKPSGGTLLPQLHASPDCIIKKSSRKFNPSRGGQTLVKDLLTSNFTLDELNFLGVKNSV
jgi:hypothetical protein